MNNRREIFDAVYSGDVVYAEAHSPWTVLRENAGRLLGRTTVRIYVGAEDELVERNERYHELLGELGIQHDWVVVPGATHELAILLEKWPGDPLAFYAQTFGVHETR